MTYQSVNPSNGEILKSFDKLNNTQLEQSLVAAESCFQTWKHTTYAERAAIVASASSHVMRANRPSPLFPTRFIGYCRRWSE